jgi:hypothetical protein
MLGSRLTVMKAFLVMGDENFLYFSHETKIWRPAEMMEI